MIYRTEDFISPTGSIMIFAEYDLDNKKVQFKKTNKYFYPQDSKHTIASIIVDTFIKENSIYKESLEEANEYLLSLGINNLFKENTP